MYKTGKVRVVTFPGGLWCHGTRYVQHVRGWYTCKAYVQSASCPEQAALCTGGWYTRIARACTSARAEAPVRIRVNAARDPHDRLHVARFGGVAVDPIEEVKETVPIVLGLWG